MTAEDANFLKEVEEAAVMEGISTNEMMVKLQRRDELLKAIPSPGSGIFFQFPMNA